MIVHFKLIVAVLLLNLSMKVSSVPVETVRKAVCAATVLRLAMDRRVGDRVLAIGNNVCKEMYTKKGER